MTMNFLKTEQIEEEFRKWWKDSYGRPPGNHAVMTHVPFAVHILEVARKAQSEEGDN